MTFELTLLHTSERRSSCFLETSFHLTFWSSLSVPLFCSLYFVHNYFSVLLSNVYGIAVEWQCLEMALWKTFFMILITLLFSEPGLIVRMKNHHVFLNKLEESDWQSNSINIILCGFAIITSWGQDFSIYSEFDWPGIATKVLCSRFSFFQCCSSSSLL